MFKCLASTLLFIYIGVAYCMGSVHVNYTAGSSFLYIEKTRDDTQKLRQEINSIRDSLQSVNQFNKAVEQSRKDKQLDIEKKHQQQQNALEEQEKNINIQKRKVYIILTIAISLLLVGILSLTYAIIKLKKSKRNITLSQVSLNEQENIYKQKLIIENITARIEAQETERERISRELHDGIGGNLVAIRLLLQSADTDNPILDELQRLVANTQQEIRAISHNLAPPRIDDIPFEHLFLHHIRNIKETTNIQVEGILLPKTGWENLNIKLQVEIFRLLQELTVNILKHSKATKVNIALRLEEETVSLLAEDNGIGFIVEKGYEGIGLQNIKLRANYLNGKIDINSTPGKGTIIMVEIPIKQL